MSNANSVHIKLTSQTRKRSEKPNRVLRLSDLMPNLLEVSRILLLAPICYLLQYIVFVEVYGDKKPTSCGYVVWKIEEYLLAFFDTDCVCVCVCVYTNPLKW